MILFLINLLYIFDLLYFARVLYSLCYENVIFHEFTYIPFYKNFVVTINCRSCEHEHPLNMKIL